MEKTSESIAKDLELLQRLDHQKKSIEAQILALADTYFTPDDGWDNRLGELASPYKPGDIVRFDAMHSLQGRWMVDGIFTIGEAPFYQLRLRRLNNDGSYSQRAIGARTAYANGDSDHMALFGNVFGDGLTRYERQSQEFYKKQAKKMDEWIKAKEQP